MFCLYSPAAGMCRSRKLQLFKFYTCVKLYVSTEAVSFSLLWTARGHRRARRPEGGRHSLADRLSSGRESSAGGVASSRGRLGPRLREGYTGLEAVLHTVDPVFSHADTSRVRCDSVFD